MSGDTTPSPADQQLIDHAQQHGFTVTVKQLETWRRRKWPLLPGNKVVRLGRGKGTESRPEPEAFDLVVALARLAGRGRRPRDLALLLFAEDLPVSEAVVRAAFTAAVDDIVLSDEASPDEGAGDGRCGVPESDEERIAQASERAAAAGAMTLVPARARRIDERIARWAREKGTQWPPPELAAYDSNPEPEAFTPKDATVAMADIMLTGGPAITPDGLGGLFRAMQPEAGANPMASLAEYTMADVPEDVGEAVFDEEDGFTLLPRGDVRDALRELAATVPLEDLRAAWQADVSLHEWAVDLAERAETELDAGEPGDAVTEWTLARWLPFGATYLLAELRPSRNSQADRARSSLSLLLSRQMLRDLDQRVPGCQWELMPSLTPPPLQTLFSM
ncbi:hypothetical protein [Streptomyces pseudovenezuelae]|uniref:hypothetical protein n=1 Tax=Streptomyces pseudovenezuelae TaxID=67350 RepID=UPI0036E28D43